MDIPTPNEVKGKEYTTVAGIATTVKAAIVSSLNRGKYRVDLPGSAFAQLDEILKILRPQFAVAGWNLREQGMYLHIEPIQK